MTRVVYLGEALVIAGAILLGAAWPSLYTIVALLVLPSLIVALVGLTVPRLLARVGVWQIIRIYLHVAAGLSSAALASQVIWMYLSHSAPVDVVVPQGVVGPVIVVYGVPGGSTVNVTEGRLIYDIPRSRVLALASHPNDGWWRESERRFFMKDASGSHVKVAGSVGSSGTSAWGGCSARFDEYWIVPERPIAGASPEVNEPGWGCIGCVDGRLTTRCN